MPDGLDKVLQQGAVVVVGKIHDVGAAAGAAAAQAARPSFARNMMMGIGAGLLGAGLFGMLSGSDRKSVV